jgi:hypothetical protein
VNRRPLKFVTREKELELIQRLETLVDCSTFDPKDTAVIMASPDYSATVAMHLAHSWSNNGEMITIIPVDVAYPDETVLPYIDKFHHDFYWHKDKYKKFVCIEAGIIRGSNWAWLLNSLKSFDVDRDDITLIAMLENIHSTIKSDYVAEYYDDEKEELMFYFEKFNKHWPIK